MTDTQHADCNFCKYFRYPKQMLNIHNYTRICFNISSHTHKHTLFLAKVFLFEKSFKFFSYLKTYFSLQRIILSVELFCFFYINSYLKDQNQF